MTTAKTPKPRKIKDKDFELIRAINSGQPEKFQDLVKKYEQKLYNFSVRMCRDPAEAEDMVQDTFLNVFRYLKNFRYETKFKNWLYRVAASTCIKSRRKSKFAPNRELSLEEFIPKNETETPRQIPDWALMPLEKLLNEELASTINQAVSSLPDKYRLVIVLRDMEGFSTAETAQILNISPANVKVRLHRARLFLRDELKGYFDHGEG
ncbi:MAG: sigma-70 family RNA polymerase sigma factor [Desulfobacterales bacterium]|nr:MAG: sigma-70 family RNA polymerase sigma factor [Desulfobacterales bacterium]